MRMRRSRLNTAGLSGEAPDVRDGRRPGILPAAVYLATAAVLISYLRFYFSWSADSWLIRCYGVVALLGAGLLLASAVYVLRARLFGHVLALAGACFAGIYLYRFYPYRFAFSPWLTFNLPDNPPSFLVAGLTILTITGLVAVAALGWERLAPSTWRIGKAAFRDRAWPGFAITLLFLLGWYLNSAVPYQVPIFSRGTPPIISVLHVEKHGLQFHETGIAFFHDSRFFVNQDDHRLFQYSFGTTGASGTLTEGYFRLLNELAFSPPALPGRRVSHYSPPLAWNADRWYVLYYGRTLARPIRTESATPPPKQIVDLFYAAQNLPKQREWQWTARDVCFGFCYAPEN